MLLPIPEPYDFELSTARFRDFGSDRATVWHEGGLYRVVDGREVRIEAAPGGVRIEPGSAEASHEVGYLLGLPLDLCAFRDWAATRVFARAGLADYLASRGVPFEVFEDFHGLSRAL